MDNRSHCVHPHHVSVHVAQHQNCFREGFETQNKFHGNLIYDYTNGIIVNDKLDGNYLGDIYLHFRLNCDLYLSELLPPTVVSGHDVELKNVFLTTGTELFIEIGSRSDITDQPILKSGEIGESFIEKIVHFHSILKKGNTDYTELLHPEKHYLLLCFHNADNNSVRQAMKKACHDMNVNGISVWAPDNIISTWAAKVNKECAIKKADLILKKLINTYIELGKSWEYIIKETDCDEKELIRLGYTPNIK